MSWIGTAVGAVADSLFGGDDEELQKKVSELNKTTQRQEAKIGTLKTTLKKDEEEDQKERRQMLMIGGVTLIIGIGAAALITR